MMKILGIIPARYASTRLPGKPLAMIGDKPMIQHVYENCKKSLEYVYVATDDISIVNAVVGFGGKAVMTDPDHGSGTERVAEAVNIVVEETGIKFDYIINIQGDEPFFNPRQIDDLVACFDNGKTELATLAQVICDHHQIFDEKEAKIVVDNNMNAVLFSRSPIPFVQNVSKKHWLEHAIFYRHMGLYGYRTDILFEIIKLEPSVIEKAESLEQLRWITNGFKVKIGITEIEETLCVDTPEDLIKANKLLAKLNY